MLNFDNDNNLEDRKFYLDLESLKLRKFLEKRNQLWNFWNFCSYCLDQTIL